MLRHTKVFNEWQYLNNLKKNKYQKGIFTIIFNWYTIIVSIYGPFEHGHYKNRKQENGAVSAVSSLYILYVHIFNGNLFLGFSLKCKFN